MNGVRKRMSKPTGTYDLYEVVKVPFPFTDIHAEKVRPAVVISSGKTLNAKIGSSILSMITSLKSDRELWPTDVRIDDLISAGLPAPSVIRFKVFTLDHRLILQRLGRLSEIDRRAVQAQLKQVFNL